MRDSLFVVAILVSFAVIHSALATAAVKKVAAAILGKVWVRRYYRLCYNALSLLLTGAAALLFLRTADVPLFTLPPPVVTTLRVMQVLSVALAALGFGVFRAGEFLGIRQAAGRTARHGNDADSEGVRVLPLQKKGVYGIVRHPMYSGCIGLFLFSPAYSRNWVILRALSVAYFIVGALIEDRRLVMTYGEVYRRYMKEVPRLLPRFRKRSLR